MKKILFLIMAMSLSVSAEVSITEMGQLDAMSYLASRCKAEVISANTNKKKNCVKMHKLMKKFFKDKKYYTKRAAPAQKSNIDYWTDNIIETDAFNKAYLSK